MSLLATIHPVVPRALALLLLAATSLSSLAQQDASEAERRRKAFEEAMRKVEDAERSQAAVKVAEAEAQARAAEEKLRAAVETQAAKTPEEFADADTKRADVQAFAGAVSKKVEPALREKFQQPAPSAPAVAPVVRAPAPARAIAAPVLEPGAPKGGIPVEGNGPAPGPERPPAAPPKGAEKEEPIIIDADGQLIFDGSGRFGDAYQIVVFEDNVRLKHPQFLMNSDKLVAFFKDKAEPVPVEGEGVIDALSKEPEGGGNQLERAIASGREVTVTQTMQGGEPQIAKARKATYYADRQEVMLEIWPQVQRGRNLVIAKSKDTVIILKGEEMIVEGPVRTKIVGKGAGAVAAPVEPKAKAGKTAEVEPTVIDAERGAVFNRPSARTGHKEIFFDGNVSVADPGFDMVGGDNLTAYTRPDPKTGESVMTSAVMRGSKVEVKERGGDGRYGTARRMVTFTPATSDILLTGYPEIFDGMQFKKYDSPDASISLNGKSKAVSGRSGGSGRSSMSFTPGMKPPGSEDSALPR